MLIIPELIHDIRRELHAQNLLQFPRILAGPPAELVPIHSDSNQLTTAPHHDLFASLLDDALASPASRGFDLVASHSPSTSHNHCGWVLVQPTCAAVLPPFTGRIRVHRGIAFGRDFQEFRKVTELPRVVDDHQRSARFEYSENFDEPLFSAGAEEVGESCMRNIHRVVG